MYTDEKNPDIIYQNLLREILTSEDAFVYKDTKRNVNCYQINDATIKFDMREGFPLLQTKEINFKTILIELLWFLSGETNILPMVEQGCNIWNHDVFNYENRLFGEAGNFKDFKKRVLEFSNPYVSPLETPGYTGGSYGTQWRKFEGVSYYEGESMYIDQFATVIDLIKRVPMARRNIVLAWNPIYAFDDLQCALPPCHWAFEILPYRLNDETRLKLFQEIRDRESERICSEAGISRVIYSRSVHGQYSEPGIWSDDIGDFIVEPGGWFLTEDEHAYFTKAGVPEYGFDLKWMQRSVDTFLGLPFNIASYGALMLIIEAFTGYKPRYLIGNLSNVHIYENAMLAVRKQLERVPSKNRVKVSLLDADKWTIEDVTNGRLTPDHFIVEGYQPQDRIKVDMLAITNNNWNNGIS